MVALAALAAIIVLAQTAVIVLLQRSHDIAQNRWEAERRELLTRIQAPERVPIAAPAGWAVPEDEEPDETALVGTIAPLAEDYVNDDGLGP